MAVVHRGRLRFIGTPLDFVARYDSTDVEEAFLACIGERVAA
ncbi:MAG: hypothetical protein ACXWUK_03790 [Burkholderiales bacterium]